MQKPVRGDVMRYSIEQKSKAMATCRGNGAVSKNAIVPRILQELIYPKDGKNILDYGCGKHRKHVEILRNRGYKVTGYDFSLEDTEDNIGRVYDFVYASNVLNVQSDLDMLYQTLIEIRGCISHHGVALVNYPSGPRKMDMSVKQLETVLYDLFGHVNKLDVPGHNVWLLTA